MSSWHRVRGNLLLGTPWCLVVTSLPPRTRRDSPWIGPARRDRWPDLAGDRHLYRPSASPFSRVKAVRAKPLLLWYRAAIGSERRSARGCPRSPLFCPFFWGHFLRFPSLFGIFHSYHGSHFLVLLKGKCWRWQSESNRARQRRGEEIASCNRYCCRGCWLRGRGRLEKSRAGKKKKVSGLLPE